MKQLGLIIVAAVLLNFVFTQNKEYACLPCGQACDNDAYTHPGECSMCHMKLVEKSTIKFSNLTVDEFCNRIATNTNIVLLDVRTPDEFKGTMKDMPTYGHFKNAININVEELEQRLGELEKFKSKEVLVYCSHSHRSPRASYLLSTHGFKNVKNMAGGVSTIINPQSNGCLRKSFIQHP